MPMIIVVLDLSTGEKATPGDRLRRVRTGLGSELEMIKPLDAGKADLVGHHFSDHAAW